MKTTTEMNLNPNQTIITFANFYLSEKCKDLNQLALNVKLIQTFPIKDYDFGTLFKVKKMIDEIMGTMEIECNDFDRCRFNKTSFITAMESEFDLETSLLMAFECRLDANYPILNIKWITVEMFAGLTGISKDTIYSRRSKGVWDEKIIKLRGGRLMVNIWAYDKWVEMDEVK